MEFQENEPRRSNGGSSKPKTKNKQNGGERQLQKPKKYHEQCFDSESKPNEKRIRYRDDREMKDDRGNKRSSNDGVNEKQRNSNEEKGNKKKLHYKERDSEKNQQSDEKVHENRQGSELRRQSNEERNEKRRESSERESEKRLHRNGHEKDKRVKLRDENKEKTRKKCSLEKTKDARLKRKPRVEDQLYEVAESEKKSECSKSHRRKERQDGGESKQHQRRRPSLPHPQSDENEDKKEFRMSERHQKFDRQRLCRSVSEDQALESRKKHSRQRGAETKSHKRLSSKKTKERNRKHDRHEEARRYYSDSEVDQTRTNISACAGDRKADSADNEKVVNIGELYDYFYREETRGRKTKSGGETASKRRESAPGVNAAIDEKTEGGNAECKQSSIRGKLIRVLFKRVKDLLKETESLRDERKEFMSQIEVLSRQVSGLRLKEEEHLSTELRIKERLNSIATADINVTGKGTTFRDEIQSILNDIQNKYVTYWQSHEQNLQRVQSQAEDKIQSLMSTVVGKYIKLNEKQTNQENLDRENSRKFTDLSSVPSNYENKGFGYYGITPNTELKDYEQPVTGRPLDSAEPTTEYSFTFSNSNSTGDTVLQNVKSNPTLQNTRTKTKCDEHVMGLENSKGFPVRYMKPLYVDTGLDGQNSGHTPGQSGQNLLRIAAPKMALEDHQAQQEQQKTRLNKNQISQPNQTNIPRSSESNSIGISIDLDLAQKQRTKDELKEFWRHKLLQPNPLETIRKEKEERDSRTTIGPRSQY